MGDASPADEDEPEWACSACSFVNSGLLAYCEICEFAKRGTTSSSAFEATQPPNACPLCSFHNPVGRSACEVCEAPLPPSQTWQPNMSPGGDIIFDRGGQGATPKGSATVDDDEEFMTPPSSPPAVEEAALANHSLGLHALPLVEHPKMDCHASDPLARPPACTPGGLTTARSGSCHSESEARTGNIGGSSSQENVRRDSNSLRETLSSGPRCGTQVRKPHDMVADEEERQLLLSMGWDPDDLEGEGGLEEWEIDAAQESFIEHLQREPHEGLQERARREFEEWRDKAAQTLPPPPASISSDAQHSAVQSGSGNSSSSGRRNHVRNAPSCGRRSHGK